MDRGRPFNRAPSTRETLGGLCSRSDLPSPPNLLTMPWPAPPVLARPAPNVTPSAVSGCTTEDMVILHPSDGIKSITPHSLFPVSASPLLQQGGRAPHWPTAETRARCFPVCPCVCVSPCAWSKLSLQMPNMRKQGSLMRTAPRVKQHVESVSLTLTRVTDCGRAGGVLN